MAPSPVIPPTVTGVTVADAAAVLRERFGRRGELHPLGSQQDANFRVAGPDGVALLKFGPRPDDPAEHDAQQSALARLGQGHPGLRLPTVLPGLDGAGQQPVEVDGHPLVARLLTWVDGAPIMDSRYLAPRVVGQLGEMAAHTVTGLADFSHPGTERRSQWDLRNAPEVVATLLGHVTEAAERDALAAAVVAARAVLDPRAADLPVQVIHGDVSDNNIVCDPGVDGRPVPVGLIDFSDLMRSWAVAELAVTCTSVLHHHGARPDSVASAVRAFDALRPLGDAELDALWPLVVLRSAVLVVCGRCETATNPGNAYAQAGARREAAMWRAASSVPVPVMVAQLRAALGRPARARVVPVPDVPLVAAGSATPVDLSATATGLDGGRWLEPDRERELLAEAAGRSGAAVTHHGEYRLSRAGLERTGPQATLALGRSVLFTEAHRVRAPWDGDLSRADEGRWALQADGAPTVWLHGLADPHPGGAVRAGDELGTTGGPLTVQLSWLDGPVPEFAIPQLAAGWLAGCPDPAPLLGLATEPAAVGSDLLRRRDRSVASVQEHYYDDPPQIERGWRHHLVDTTAQTYVDVINNVTALGHAHPAVAAAVHQQLQRLNTNSRFSYAAIVALAERLAGLLPDPLDTVFFVNSGSEAVDLALRLVLAATGRRDVLAVAEAYHGWTYASDAVSSSVADNPNALTTRPDWVHLLDAPNAYRGRYRGAEAGRYAQDAVRRIGELVTAGRPPAGFVAESPFGNAGGVLLPPGYLAAVYDAVRAAGGLCIADEVQVGLGRLGRHFWGFEQQGVVPDVVTVAKSMGNGHPLGAVITSREVAEAYRRGGYFFSSTGGSPVSSVVGLTVLDVLAAEDLPGNAEAVGAYLAGRLGELMAEHEMVGAVHGAGLYLGLELVRDRATLEPATEETAAVCERLRDFGVVVAPTSDRQNVLKVKPPLCFTRSAADHVVDALDEILRTGW